MGFIVMTASLFELDSLILMLERSGSYELRNAEHRIFHMLQKIAELPPLFGKDYLSIIGGRDVRILVRDGFMDLTESKAVLVWCARGEKFCDGHLASIIQDGTLLGVLNRFRAFIDSPL